MAVDPHASTPADWLVPHAPAPVHALVRLPGSKSMTNRALILAALSDGPVLITGPLIARDTQLMAGALRALRCRIEESAGSWRVTSARAARSGLSPGETRGGARPAVDIDVGNAGTVLRFVPPLAALTDSDVTFRGDARVSQRPVGPLLDALRALGADIADDGTGAVPFVVHGHGGVRGGTVTIDASSSSQLVSGLLLAAPRFATSTLVRHWGPPVPSAPHIEMTVRMLRACGVEVTSGAGGTSGTSGPADPDARPRGDALASGARFVDHSWRVLPGPIRAERIDIEPDLSNALPFLAAAIATGGEVTVAGWPSDSLQPATRIVELLTSMGASVRHTAQGLAVSGPGQITGVGADLSEVGELTPVLTALAALASSPSEFTGIGHLRRHESDRLAALAGEIGKLGGDVTELADGLRIRPAPLRADGVVFDSHDDHRLVMAAAVLGLVVDGLRVHNPATVAKTFPEFSGFWARIAAPAG
ncbi:MAG TPA: 3-phosphoshikimate 1-carboxyvinyltransferase [Streptosporangiaceae bacterium]|nr:3-phosphoshikimate 1-carboxyvinyltransferase [Streptosporangiaceae bacterium]